MTASPVTIGRDGIATAVATCPAGASVISGGYDVDGAGSPPPVSVSSNHAQGNGAWTVTVRTLPPTHRQLVVSATCLS